MLKTVKNRISLVLLALFISMKLVGLHVLTHDGDKEHLVQCKLCEQAVMGNLFQPALLAETLGFQSNSSQVLVKKQIVDCYTFIFCDNFTANPIFSRPPPAGINSLV